MKSHMSGIISESFINRPRLGRVHLRLQSFPGLGSKASWLLNNNLFFQCYFTYLFYRSLGPFIRSDPLWKHTCAHKVQNLWGIFCLDIPQSGCAVKEGLLSWSFALPSSLFFFKNNPKHVPSTYVPVGVFVRHSWPSFPTILIGGDWVFLHEIKSLKEDVNSFVLWVLFPSTSLAD